jgi:2-phospho-L-lactate guanylyltransferase
MDTLAILPVKRFGLAKQRLGERLDPEQRQALAQAMVTDVLTALVSVRRLAAVLVVTNEPVVSAIAGQLGAEVLADTPEAGQSAAASIGLAEASRRGFHRALLVPGDCPALDVDEVDALLTATAERRQIIVVPDRHGTGTNALLLSPPDVMAPAFGPGSFERHRRLAAAAEIPCEVRRPSSLLLDVDTPEDLEALLRAAANDCAPQTRAVYQRIAA